MERVKESVGSPETKGMSSENELKLGKIATVFTQVIENPNLDEEANSRAEKHEKEAEEELKYWSGEYGNIELDYLNSNNKLDYKEFEKWEEAAADAFSKLKKAEKDVQFDSMYDRDAFERLPAVDGHLSIEAFGGNFYDQRNREIVEAVMAANNEECEQEKETIGSLHELVCEYIYATKDFKLKGMDENLYQKDRQKKHNNVINRINEIDQIAKKYGKKPLIFREMMTNDFAYDEKLDHSGETNARAEYDRAAVEAYIRLAFSSDFKEEEQRNENIPLDNNQSIVAQMHKMGED